MRNYNYLVISVVIHAAVMLWLVLAPSAKTFNPASPEAIMVDLLPAQDAPAEQESPKSDETKTEEAKTEEAKSPTPKAELPRPAPRKPEIIKPEIPKPNPEANQKPTSNPVPNDNSKTAAEDSAQERAATAARLAWMLNLPTDTSASLAGPPSEDKSNLASTEIAEFKAQVSKCWVTPAGVPNTPGFDVLIRIALNPDGKLGAKPELIRAPASMAGPPLVDSAKRALQKCQPYATLPADRYRDWKIMELSFTAQGPASLSGPPSRGGGGQ
jgi:hypothetical protein